MRILIVDDIEENLYLLETLLKGNGYEVVAAKDGVEALDKLKKEPIDIIISDILMPRMDGFQLCRECKKDDSLKKIPFIFYTATYTEKKDEEFALSLGVERFIVKPQEPKVLLKILGEVIEEHEKGALVTSKEIIKEEEIYLTGYNKRLIQKLEKKMLDLEKSEKRIKYLYSVLGAIRGVNQLIVKEKDRGILIQKTCDVLVGVRGYHTAWLGLLKDEKNFAMVVGSPLGADISRFCAQVLRGDYSPCIKKALTKKDLFMFMDRSRDCGDCSLKKLHLGRNSLLIHITHKNKLFGFLVLSLEPDVYIDQEEKELLEEVTSDIAFGLYNIELEAQHKQSEEEIQLHAAMMDNVAEGVYLVGLDDLRIKWTNEKFSRMFGYDPGEMGGMHVDMVNAPTERTPTETRIAIVDVLRETGEWHGEVKNIKRDGTHFWCYANVSLFEHPEYGKVMVAVSTDITERKQAEQKLLQSHNKLLKTMEDTIYTIGKIAETRDPYTSGHQKNVSQIATFIAQEMKLPKDKSEGIRIASLVHDIGKISLPAEILNKPIKLSNIEFNLIKDHSQTGHDILKSIEFPWPIAQIVLQHHERLDGSGYPNKLKGDEIVLEARIIGVADVIDAMSSHRPYRPALGIDKALEEISKNKGILYDPEVVDVCLKLFKEK